jgi:hypothetical protein
MDRDQGLRLLGLAAGAGSAEIHQAYGYRSSALKNQILCAERAVLKDQHRESLRQLVMARDAALGLPPRRSWASEPLPMSGKRLMRKLIRTQMDSLDDRGARAFLGLSPQAQNDQVRDAYQLRKRVLIRTFVTAHDDEELAHVRRARMKLRTIRNFALAN